MANLPKYKIVVDDTVKVDSGLKTVSALITPVISIDGEPVNTNVRKIGVDQFLSFWYLHPRAKYWEMYTRVGAYQGITLNGKRFQLAKDCVELVPVGFKVDTLTVGDFYQLRNGAKLKVVAFEKDPNFISEPSFIGVYNHLERSGMARYSATGTRLSHGNDYNFDIVAEWKPVNIWVVISHGANGLIETKTCYDEASAEQAKVAVGNKFIKTVCEEIQSTWDVTSDN